MKRQIYKWLFFNIMGWKITGAIDKSILKSVFIIVPHTSWVDFFVAFFTRGIIDMEVNWVGKKELFDSPIGWYFRWMGGEPLDRKGGLNTVDSISEIFKKRTIFRLGISPEGTRKKVKTWKSGFYYIAQNAQVPIIPIAFDFENKTIVLHPAFYPTANKDQDFDFLMRYFDGVKGKIAANSFEIDEAL